MRARAVDVRENRVVAVGAGGLFLVFGIIGLASIVIVILTAVDTAKYPDWAFERAGTSKFVWQILPITCCSCAASRVGSWG